MEATVDTTAPPTVTEPTAPASPAIADTSVSAPVVSERPKSFKESFERIEAKQPPVKTAAATTVQSGAAVPPVNPTAPIPLDVHTKALDNARIKAVAEYQQKYGWAEQVPQQTFQRVATDLNSYHTDPIGFVMKRIAEIESDPQWGPQWKARQAQPASTAPNLDPDVEVIGPDGKVTGTTYSAERQKALLKHELDQALKPFQTEREQREAATKQAETERLEAAAYKQREKVAEAQMEEIADILDIKIDYTKPADPLIADTMAMWAQHPEWSAHRSALEVRKTKVQPRLAAQGLQQATDEMKRKAAGNTANGSGTTAMPARPKNEKELSKWLENREAQRANQR